MHECQHLPLIPLCATYMPLLLKVKNNDRIYKLVKKTLLTIITTLISNILTYKIK